MSLGILFDRISIKSCLSCNREAKKELFLAVSLEPSYPPLVLIEKKSFKNVIQKILIYVYSCSMKYEVILIQFWNCIYEFQIKSCIVPLNLFFFSFLDLILQCPAYKLDCHTTVQSHMVSPLVPAWCLFVHPNMSPFVSNESCACPLSKMHFKNNVRIFC